MIFGALALGIALIIAGILIHIAERGETEEDWTNEISLVLIEKYRRTGTKFLINFETLGVENIRIHITEGGSGIEHELIELDLVRTVLKNYPNIVEYPWHYSKALFHYLTDLFLGED